VEKWETNSGTRGLQALRLKTGAGFPAHPKEIYAVYQSQVYPLTTRDGVLELSGQTPESLATHFSREKLSPAAYNNNYFPGADNNPDGSEVALRMMPLLMARATSAPEVFPTMVAPADHQADLQLLIVAPMPAAFQVQGPGFTRETGWVLYVQDVFMP